MISSFISLYLVLAGVFATTHLFALRADLYWYFWWFDILMHGWGGFLIIYGLIVIATLPGLSRVVPRSPLALAVTLLGIVIAWEIFEYVIGTGLRTEDWPDTILDIIMGAVGGAVAYYCFKSRLKKTSV